MSDLISRSELIDFLRTENQRCITSTGHELTMNIVYSFINHQPTAYDIDKVVQELEEQKNTYLHLHKEEEAENGYTNKSQILYDKACSFECAIEIVKQGGVSDDVCEWVECYELKEHYHPKHNNSF